MMTSHVTCLYCVSNSVGSIDRRLELAQGYYKLWKLKFPCLALVLENHEKTNRKWDVVILQFYYEESVAYI